MKDRPYHFEGAIDRGRTRAGCETGTNKFFQGAIVHLMRLEVADMSDQEPHVPFDHLGASQLARLSEVSSGAVAEQGMGMGSTFPVEIQARDLGAQLPFGILLTNLPETQE